VQVRAAVAELVEVHPADGLQRLDRTHHPDRQHPQLGGHRVVQVAEVQVLARHEHHPERQPRLLEGREHPALVRPDDVPLRVGAAPAVDASLAGPGRLGQRERVQRLDPQRAGLEREDLPHRLLRQRQPALGIGGRDDPMVEVLRRWCHSVILVDDPDGSLTAWTLDKSGT
jgi:hypothetical protein